MIQHDLGRKLLFGLAAMVAGPMIQEASAFHGWGHGSSGGSSGGYYSSGGSSGGYYRGHGYRSWNAYGSSGGSSGGYYYSGSSGGSSGGYYYGGSSGGSSGGYSTSYGSSGGSSGGYYSSGSVYSGSAVINSSPMMVQPGVPSVPTTPGAPVPANPRPIPGPGPSVPDSTFPGPEKGTFFTPSSTGTLTVSVPADAKVYVNDTLTTSTGTQRQYVSRGLEQGKTYTYSIRVETVREGKTISETKTAQLASGRNAELAFNMTGEAQNVAAGPSKTTLSLRVPADAKVVLAGSNTNTPGTVREFTTSKLTTGSQWEGYKIVVSIDRNGQTVVKEQTITLIGGETRELAFDFDAPQVASSTSAE